jgi:hypothetical protein
MPVDLMAIVGLISGISALVKTIRDGISTLASKGKNEELLGDLQQSVGNLETTIQAIGQGAWSIDGYLRLYSESQGLETTSNAATKALLSIRDEDSRLQIARLQIARQLFHDLRGKFNSRIQSFMRTFGDCLDAADGEHARTCIARMDGLLGKADAYLEKSDIDGILSVFREFGEVSADLSGRANAKVEYLTRELMKITGGIS